jgi:sulfur carrier protein
MIISVNGERRELAPPVRLLDVLGLPPDEPTPRGIAVAVDGVVVPRSRHASTELRDGARVEIVKAVQGG